MKRLALASAALALAVLFSAPSFAADASSGPVTCTDGTTSPHGGRGACSKHGGIKKDDAAAATAAAPAAPAAPAKVTKSADAASAPVTCTDGTTSPKGGRGACSKHGGIKKDDAAAPAAAAKPAAAPAAPAKPAAAVPATPAAPAAAPSKTASTAGSGGSVNSDASGATAKCKDGSYSHSKTHSGTCSKHGGVADWLDGSAKQ